jgi:phosphatidylinositol glycan class F
MSSLAPASPVKPSLPIELLPTDLARIFSHAHPALLLSAYALRFQALVADPTTTLLNTLLPLAVLQTSYAILCLPATGSSTKPAKKPKPGAKKTNDATSSSKFLVALPPSPFSLCGLGLY